MMNTVETVIENVAVISFHANMFGDTQTQQLSERIKHYLGRGINRVILDFHGVKLINSIGVGILMSCWSSLKRREGKLILVGINEKINSILEIVELAQFFEIYPTIDQAIIRLQAKGS